MDVDDCVDGILLGYNKSKNNINIFNLGQDYAITVKQSINKITTVLNLKPNIEFLGGKRGWIGDSPKIILDVKNKITWVETPIIYDSIERTIKFLKKINENFVIGLWHLGLVTSVSLAKLGFNITCADKSKEIKNIKNLDLPIEEKNLLYYFKKYKKNIKFQSTEKPLQKKMYFG